MRSKPADIVLGTGAVCGLRVAERRPGFETRGILAALFGAGIFRRVIGIAVGDLQVSQLSCACVKYYRIDFLFGADACQMELFFRFTVLRFCRKLKRKRKGNRKLIGAPPE
ncbi:MAG: hypothetical protein DBX55_09675 [Verrucomicrobia bacterium]|nr:MAG: hypothetical protein DBX55_09675 [Verrucomicrobiota bacterium]